MKIKINKPYITESIMGKVKAGIAVGSVGTGLAAAHQLNDNKLSDSASKSLSKFKSHESDGEASTDGMFDVKW